MSRVDLLLRLYRLALHPPGEDQIEPMSRWLAERQELIDRLQGLLPAAPGPAVPMDPVARALLALVLHADEATTGRLLLIRRRLGQMLQRRRGYS